MISLGSVVQGWPQLGELGLALVLSAAIGLEREIRLTYLDGRGVLRRALTACTDRGFTVGELSVQDEEDDRRSVTVWITVQGSGSVSDLVVALKEIDGVRSASGDDANNPDV